MQQWNYFWNNNEFRVILEWTPKNTPLSYDATRDARVGLFAYIQDNKFTKFDARICADNMFSGGGGNANRIMCAAPKSDKVWDQDPAKSGFTIDN